MMTMQTWEDADSEWRRDAEAHGWKIAHRAAWPLRVWGIRHVRWFVQTWRVHSFAESFAAVGIGLGRPNQRDLWVLYAIRRGWA